MSINQFAAKIYSVIKKEKENLFFSPFSIQMAAAMPTFGSKGKTREELSTLIPTTEESISDLYKNVINGDGYDMLLANALWLQNGQAVKAKFAECMQETFKASMNSVDFCMSINVCAQINRWAREKTKNKVDEIISENAINVMTKFVVTNAIYFKSLWDKQFFKTETVDRVFYSDYVSRSVKMMKKSEVMPYYKGMSYQSVQIPYKNNATSMLIILPVNGGLVPDAFKTVENSLDEDFFKEILNHSYSRLISLSLPKFKLESKMNLRQVLIDLGVKEAFSEEADFGDMCNDKIAVGEIIHKSVIDVAEEGTLAGSATAATTKFLAPPPADAPIIFSVDKPFIFAIINNHTKDILFLGRVKSF